MGLGFISKRIRFDRNELSGAFGDIGTDLPLIVAMLAVTDLKAANIFIIFGILQILTSFIYGIPMPVQPLKVVALIVITQKLTPAVIFGGGLAIGVIMLILSLTGVITYLNRFIPKAVIRGIQLGLGLQLCLLSMKDLIPANHVSGYVVAIIAFAIGIVFIGNKKWPPAVFIILLGFVYTLVFNVPLFERIAFRLPVFEMPRLSFEHVLTGFLLLSLPQLPLSLANSVFATRQMVTDYFPEKKITARKIGITYSFMNIIAALLGGIPVCHGSGGIAGHYTFGGRTGGSTFIYGLFYILTGLFFGINPGNLFLLFPKPILGAILFFEGIALILLSKNIFASKRKFFIAVMVGLMANGLPYGYLAGMIAGTVIYYLPQRWILRHFGE